LPDIFYKPQQNNFVPAKNKPGKIKRPIPKSNDEEAAMTQQVQFGI
jgi:hypothetical protein